ncbi:MAG: TIGR01777 family protein [Roseivirga sp.]|nr:TIGR01777 family protein [Roseivirga sp.]
MAQNILVTGGTGLVGSLLIRQLQQQGHRVSLLGRSKKTNSPYPNYKWDYANDYLEEGALDGVDTIVHLAGAGVAEQKWTKDRKTVIFESRTQTSHLLYKRLKEGNHSVKTIVAASAIGLYGSDTGNAIIREGSPVGHDFLAHVVDAWELATRKYQELGIRVVQLRIGVVLSHEGGALTELLKPPVAAGLGKGNQYMSWIHIDDLVQMIVRSMEDETFEGPYNAVAPRPVSNKELTQAAAKAFRKPFMPINVPSLILKVMLGEMAVIVLGGSRISSEKIQKAGFEFKFSKIEEALRDLAGKK